MFVLGFFIYKNFPLEMIRKTDVALGNNIIQKIEQYKLNHNRLPTEDDWKTLEKLGFEIKDLGTHPSYTKNIQGTYEIAFLEGFDGPYLIWNSIDKKWKIDFPTIFNKTVKNDYTIFKGNQILFIRPSDEKFKSLDEEQGIYEVDSDFGFGIQQTMDSLQFYSKYKQLTFVVVTDQFIEIADCKNGPIKIDTDTLLYRTILTAPDKYFQILQLQSVGYLDEINAFYEIK